MKCFHNALVYLEGEGIKRTSVAFGEKIISVGQDAEETVELPDGALVVPGFLDEHVHGAGGADAMDATPSALGTISRTLAEEGTTAFLATTMTAPPEAIERAVRAAGEFRAAGRYEGAECLGVHLEGPFIAAAHRGAQPLSAVAAPDVGQFERYMEASGGCIRMVTLAPEAEGAEELIRRISALGAVPSVGHTGAAYSDVVRAISAGARGVTHTFNAQSPLHHREIGTAGSALLLDELCCELICDTIHVSVPAMRLLAKCKPADKLTLITDAMRAKGLSDGVSELGGQTVYVKNGEARLQDGTLAGSVLRMNVAVRNLVKEVGVPLERAIDCATANPARTLGVYGERGSIRPGKRADFAVLDGSFGVIMTVRGGVPVYVR